MHALKARGPASGRRRRRFAEQRYYGSGTGSFFTADPGGMRTANPADPTSWNRYAYVRGDPVNRVDSGGLCDVLLAGITMNPGQNAAYDKFGSGMISAFPYSGTSLGSGVGAVSGQALGPNTATQLAEQAIMAAAQDPGPINIFTFSGGAQAFAAAILLLPSKCRESNQ